VEPDMIPFAVTFSNSARLNISDDGPAQLLSNLPVQPPMDATRPILQDLNLSLDIQHQHLLQFNPALLTRHTSFGLPTQPIQHCHRLPSIPRRQLQHSLIILYLRKDVVCPYTKPLHLRHINRTLMWQRVRALPIYLHDVDAVGICVEEAEDGSARAVKPCWVIADRAEEAAGGQVRIAFCLQGKSVGAVSTSKGQF
jgi:hypothetical protein